MDNIKHSGIIRRIDELGRIVIPKEIRRVHNIREGDPLEIISTDNGVYLQPYLDHVRQRDAVTSPAEKARQEMLAFARTQIVPKELFGRSIEFVPLAALESFLQKHLHDGYDYSAMNQPETCIHHPGHTCGYPISDCPNCPRNTGDFSGTTCSIQ